jgi:hypothetical protein
MYVLSDDHFLELSGAGDHARTAVPEDGSTNTSGKATTP